MPTGRLLITYTSENGKPLSIATIDDPQLLLQAARVAFRQAKQRANDPDCVLAELKAAEIERLRTALSIVAPGFEACELASVM
jgi:hypothetical protein